MSEIILSIDGREYRVTNSGLVSVDTQSLLMQKLDGIDKRLDGIDRRLDGVEHRLDGIDRRLDSADKRLGAVETELTSQRKDIEALTTAMIEFDKTQYGMTRELGMLEHIIYWGFALVTLTVAFVSWLRPKDTKPEPPRYEFEESVRRIVREMLPDTKH